MDNTVVEMLYKELRKGKNDYVFFEENAVIISKLKKYCRSNKDFFFWYLGGPIFWFFNWRAAKKIYQKESISKVEQRIIGLLSNYEITIKNDCCVLIKKDL